jgi:hypothetical protein
VRLRFDFGRPDARPSILCPSFTVDGTIRYDTVFLGSSMIDRRNTIHEVPHTVRQFDAIALVVAGVAIDGVIALPSEYGIVSVAAGPGFDL